MKISTLINSKNGFSIVEITIAMGLLGALSLGVMKLMENSQKAAKNIENKDEISQLQHEISDILRNPINCEASLGSKVAGSGGVDMFSNVISINQVINGSISPKFTATNTITNKVTIQSMRIKSVDFNGSDGSLALATLEISFKKPTSSIGGQTIKKEIKVSANTCWKKIIQNTNLQTLMSECSGAGKKLIEGPHSWNNTNWAVCQDCSDASQYNAIRSCQSQGDGGGVDTGNLSKISCLNMGATYDETTLTCKFGEGASSLQARLCTFETKLLSESMTGGRTTLCVPATNVTGAGLVNGLHTKEQCTSSGGVVQENFCKFNVTPRAPITCPSGWTQYKFWSNNDAINKAAFNAPQKVQTPKVGFVPATYCHACTNSGCTAPSESFEEHRQWYSSCKWESCVYEQGDYNCERNRDPQIEYSKKSMVGCY